MAQLQLKCDFCRLLWEEDRAQGDSPIGPWAFVCPRCGGIGTIFRLDYPLSADDDPPYE
jgi:hypothetical protein